jgi:hypothetical protein
MHPGMKYIPNREEYIRFIDYIDRNFFKDMEQTESYFGLELECDRDAGYYTQSILEYNGNIGYCPDSFPAIVYYHFEDLEDRTGKFWIRDVYWETAENLGIKISEYKKPTVKLCKWRDTILSKYAWRKCKSCDGYCKECDDYWADGLYLGFTEEELAEYCEFSQERDNNFKEG